MFFVGFVWLFLIFRYLCADETHPLPLSRGEMGKVTFLFENE